MPAILYVRRFSIDYIYNGLHLRVHWFHRYMKNGSMLIGRSLARSWNRSLNLDFLRTLCSYTKLSVLNINEHSNKNVRWTFIFLGRNTISGKPYESRDMISIDYLISAYREKAPLSRQSRILAFLTRESLTARALSDFSYLRYAR